MEMIEKIRAKCIEANPEIVELKFGCEVDVKYTNVNPRKVATGVFEIGDGKDLVYLASNVGGAGEMVYLKRYEPSDNFIQKIIGRPIRLADVLLAIQNDWRKPLMSGQMTGEFTLGLRILAHWDLKNDDLEKQSDETITIISTALALS